MIATGGRVSALTRDLAEPLNSGQLLYDHGMEFPEYPDVANRRKSRLRRIVVMLVVMLVVICGWGLFNFQKSRSGIRHLSALGGEIGAKRNRVSELISEYVEIDNLTFASDRDVTGIKLSGPQITDRSLQALRRFGSLRGIILEKAAVTDAGLDHLVSAKGVMGVELDDLPGVTDQGIAELAQLPRLRELKLVHCQISCSQIPELSQVELLRLYECRNVDDSMFEDARRLKSLRDLSLRDCQGITDAGLAELATAPQLKLLRLESMPITGRYFSRLTSLEMLELRNCPDVNDAALEQIGRLTNLKWLIIHGSPVTDAGLESLGDLTGLDYLDMDGLDLTDEGLQFISEAFPVLTCLSLGHLSGITDEGVLKLSALKSLQIVSIRHSGISPETGEELSNALPRCRKVYIPE